MKHIKLFAGLSVLFLLVGCVSTTTVPKPKEETKEPNKVVEQASFYVADNTIIARENKPKDRVDIEWFIDPFCPACVRLEEIMEDSMEDITSKATIQFHILSFLGPKSVDNYSERAAGYILSAAEHVDGKIAYKFFQHIMNNNFKPENGKGIETPDSKFKELFLTIEGATEEMWNLVDSNKAEFIQETKELTSNVFNNPTLTDKANDGRIVVPFVVIGDSEKALNFSEVTDVKELFMNTLNNFAQPKAE